MLSNTQYQLELNQSALKTSKHKLAILKRLVVISTVAIMTLMTTGCATTQEFKPTASVIVGGHKSL